MGESWSVLGASAAELFFCERPCCLRASTTVLATTSKIGAIFYLLSLTFFFLFWIFANLSIKHKKEVKKVDDIHKSVG